MAEELLQFESDTALAANAAVEAVGAFGAASATRPFCVALSGGRIARDFFDQITRQVRETSADLAHVEFFWADERCVPPSDPESNFRLAQEHLLQPLNVAAHNVHRIRGEMEPPFAAREAEAELRAIARDQSRGQPVLDLVFLGMGEDGHVASLFPSDLEELTSGAVYRPVIGPKPPPHRITLSYPALAAARRVWVIASGSGKATALKASLIGGAHTPLGRLLQMRDRTRIFTDIRSM